MKSFKIYVSSPEDVSADREIASNAISRLNNEREFANNVKIQEVSPNSPGMARAKKHSKRVNDTSTPEYKHLKECDLVVLLLWSSLGAESDGRFQKEDGTPCSEVEWLYSCALSLLNQTNKPEIWIYRRVEKIDYVPGDSSSPERFKRWDKIEQFFNAMKERDGSIVRGFNEYKDSTEFKDRFLDNLRNHIPEWLSNQGREKAARETSECKVEIESDRFGLLTRLEYFQASMIFRWVQPGCFLMGSSHRDKRRRRNEGYRKTIINYGFWISETVVTIGFWRALMKGFPIQSTLASGELEYKLDYPIVNVSWNDAVSFINVLNRIYFDVSFRLPREDEWEYACRATETDAFCFGDNINADQANFRIEHSHFENEIHQRREEISRVKSHEPNRWGLFDMHGNVWEWCDTAYPQKHSTRHGADSGAGVDAENEGRLFIARGGSWRSPKERLRAAYRHSLPENTREDDLGFRLVMQVKSLKSVR